MTDLDFNMERSMIRQFCIFEGLCDQSKVSRSDYGRRLYVFERISDQDKVSRSDSDRRSSVFGGF